MSMLKLDPATGFLVRENGSFQRVDGLEAVAQHVSVRFRLYRGEVPWDLSRGVLWQGWLLGGEAPDERIENELMDVAQATPGVVSVTDARITRLPNGRATMVWSGVASEADERRRRDLHDTFAVDLRG